MASGFEGLGPRRPGIQALHKPYNNWNHGDSRGKENGQMESALVQGLEGLRLSIHGECFGKPNPNIKNNGCDYNVSLVRSSLQGWQHSILSFYTSVLY